MDEYFCPAVLGTLGTRKRSSRCNVVDVQGQVEGTGRRVKHAEPPREVVADELFIGRRSSQGFRGSPEHRGPGRALIGADEAAKRLLNGRIDTGFGESDGIEMAQRMNGNAPLADTGPEFPLAQGFLDTASGHGSGAHIRPFAVAIECRKRGADFDWGNESRRRGPRVA